MSMKLPTGRKCRRKGGSASASPQARRETNAKRPSSASGGATAGRRVAAGVRGSEMRGRRGAQQRNARPRGTAARGAAAGRRSRGGRSYPIFDFEGAFSASIGPFSPCRSGASRLSKSKTAGHSQTHPGKTAEEAARSPEKPPRKSKIGYEGPNRPHAWASTNGRAAAGAASRAPRSSKLRALHPHRRLQVQRRGAPVEAPPTMSSTLECARAAGTPAASARRHARAAGHAPPAGISPRRGRGATACAT